ncbi:unnamed protein product [Durusdinium trenchii]|uniref:Uncharacterized protein n=1 Tax=Durusdinium trenchii TaxID=1381693 RepID=A0ABP0LVN0_9DINO
MCAKHCGHQAIKFGPLPGPLDSSSDGARFSLRAMPAARLMERSDALLISSTREPCISYATANHIRFKSNESNSLESFESALRAWQSFLMLAQKIEVRTNHKPLSNKELQVSISKKL